MREEEIFTTAASAGFNTGAKPSAFGGAASTFFQPQRQPLAAGIRTNRASPTTIKPAPLRPPKINTPEIAATAIERRICNIP